MTNRSSTQRVSLLVGLLGATCVLAACDDAAPADDGADVDGATTRLVEGEVHLEASADLFADEAFSARAEATAPGVSASLDVEAWGAATVDAHVVATRTDDGVAIDEARAGAAITIEGGVALDGHLIVDLPGVPDHDGPIPGLDDHAITFAATGSVDALWSGAGATTDLSPSALPGVDLPGGAGRLTLAIGGDSHVETHLVVECASADAATIEVRGTLVTTGRLVLQPSLEVEVPVVGVESIALVQAEIAIEGRAEVVLRAEVAELATTSSAPHSPDLPACR